MNISSNVELTDRLQVINEVERLRLALSSASEIVFDYTVATDTVFYSDNAEAVFEQGNLVRIESRATFLESVGPESRILITAAIQRSGASGEPYEIEYQVRAKGGEIAWLEDRGVSLVDENGNLVRVVGVLRVISERKANEDRLAQQASYDDLTGHFNRARLRGSVETVIENAERSGAPAGFIVAGIDDLADVNENYGYDVADEVIVEVGRLLQKHLRDSDLVGRLSGNKFGLLLANCAPDVLRKVAETMQSAVRNTVMQTNVGPVSVTISLGCIMLPQHAASAGHAFARAEEALVQAKSSGRDRIFCFEHSAAKESARRRKMRIANQIISALDEDRLALAYQPIFSTKTRKIDFYETLLRIVDEKGELIAASEFIPVAEQVGLMHILDRRVVEMAVSVLHDNPQMELSLNVSGLTATDPAWFLATLEWLSGHQVVLDRLIVEITETVAIHDTKETASFVSGLRDLGCRVAIDDFGAGYTSFRNLQSLDFNMVKIDGSFVRDLVASEDNQFFVRTLIALAQKFDLKTVAEWVGNDEEIRILTECGCDYLQGHYLGEPELEPAGIKVGPPFGRIPKTNGSGVR